MRWATRAAALLLVALAIPVVQSTAACAVGEKATVVIDNGATVETFCVELDGTYMSGLEALEATGLAVQTKNFGALGDAVCRIGAVGNPPGDCPGGGGHWHYWHGRQGEWVSYESGPSSTRVGRRGIEGWSWSESAGVEPSAPARPARTCSKARPLERQGTVSTPLSLGVLAGTLAAMTLAARVIRRRGGK